MIHNSLTKIGLVNTEYDQLCHWFGTFSQFHPYLSDTNCQLAIETLRIPLFGNIQNHPDISWKIYIPPSAPPKNKQSLQRNTKASMPNKPKYPPFTTLSGEKAMIFVMATSPNRPGSPDISRILQFLILRTPVVEVNVTNRSQLATNAIAVYIRISLARSIQNSEISNHPWNITCEINLEATTFPKTRHVCIYIYIHMQ